MISKSLLDHLLKVLKFLSSILIRIGYLIIYLVESTLIVFRKLGSDILDLYSKIHIPRIKKLIRRRKKYITAKLPASIYNYLSTKATSRKTRSHKLKKIRIRKVPGFILGVIFSFTFIYLPVTIVAWFKSLPNPADLIEKGTTQSTRLLDRKGRLLYEIYVDKSYNPVSLSVVPKSVIDATLAIEDPNFYSHNGVRPLSMLRALRENLTGESLQGGSTITQQLVKNVLLTPERTIERKLKEAALSLMVESRYSKDQILELYLNNISYGGTAWGIQTAAQKYFGKNVRDLTLSESALLAGLITAPSVYSPKENDITLAKERQKIVLNRMSVLGYISPQESADAYATDLKLIPPQVYIRAPHFVEYVRRLLEEQYGKRYLETAGLTITTTLDLDMQDQVQQTVRDEVAKSANLNISNGAAVVLDPKTGDILAYVGSIDYFAPSFGSYDVVTALRQPGSSIKAVTYSLALSKGYTAASIINDSPVVYKNQWETYKPVNYDGKYHGNVTLRTALANSYNIPAVKLASALGPDNIVQLGHDMGLTNWAVDGSYGVSVTLGGKEVRLLDLTNVYATLSREGIYKDVQPILSVKNSKGNELYIKKENSRAVLTPEVSYVITNILSDYYARLPAFGANNFLSIKGHTVAAKTGTTDQKRDNYTFGYTPSYVVGVWVGNNDNKAMNPYLASGLSGAAPIWNKVMINLLGASANEAFAVPNGILAKKYTECGNRVEVFDKLSKIPESLCKVAKTETKETKKDKKS